VLDAEELLSHASLKSLNLDLSGINAFDKQLISKTLDQIRRAKVSIDPNMTFQELRRDVT
jgi:hypothetical protein